MDGVRVISSVAVLLFVLLASFSAAREERSPRRASSDWAAVTQAEQATYKYLAVLKYNTAFKCSGSIPSKWTVLTYCAEAKDDGKTKAYAGMLAVADAASAQERDVKEVVADNTLKELKLCILTAIWDFEDKVGSVQLRGSGDSCTVLGFGTSTAMAARMMTADIDTTGDCFDANKKDQFGSVSDEKKKLEGLDFGGPVVCDGKQRGISKENKASPACNIYIELATHSDWIEKAIQEADPEAPAGPDGPGGTGGTGGTGGNGTASSGYSIHSHLNKYSNWKVLWFLVPPIVAFLQY